MVDVPHFRSIGKKRLQWMNLFDINFPTVWRKHYVDRMYSSFAIVMRSTVNIIVQSAERMHVWQHASRHERNRRRPHTGALRAVPDVSVR